MFGTLKPHLCVLNEPTREAYNRFYCGLCKSLGDHYGQVTRGLLSQDAVFMALLADGVADEAAAPGACRCPIAPVVFRPTVVPDSTPMRYAAAVQILLGDQWLADRAMDGGVRGAAAPAVRGLLAGHVAVAREMLAALGVPTDPLEGFEARQARREVPGVTRPAEAAEPTATALGYVFERLAELPGMPEAVRDGRCRAALRALGQAVGRAIYLRDALEDLQGDYLGGAFNPCVEAGPGGTWEVSPARVAEAAALLESDLASFGSLLAALPWRRHRALVEHILCERFAGLSRAATVRARTWAGADGRALLATCARYAWHEALTARLALLVLAFWAWLGRAGEAWARPPGPVPTPSATPHHAGACANGRGVGYACTHPTDTVNRCCDAVCQQASDACFRASCTGCSRVSGDCARSCSEGWSECANGCSRSWSGCCQGPNSCCQTCSSCNHGCGDCCAVCNSCHG